MFVYNTVVLVVVLPLHAQTTPVPIANQGSISGIVLDDSGAAVAGATILYSNVIKYQPDAQGRPVPVGPAVSSGTTTDSTGAFTITGLPDGDYNLCVFGVNPNQLPTCEWGPWTAPVTVASGGAVSGLAFTVVTGTVLTFQVSDPQGLIQDTATNLLPSGLIPFSDGNFRIGVLVSGRYARAMFLSEQAGVRQYTVAVPKTGSLNPTLDTTLNVGQPGYPPMVSGQPGAAILVTGQPELYVSLQVQ